MKDRPNFQQNLQNNREALKIKLDDFFNKELPGLLAKDFSTLTAEEKQNKAEELAEKIMNFDREINRYFGNTPEYKNNLWKLWNSNLDNYFTILEKLDDTVQKNILSGIYQLTIEDLASKEPEFKAPVSTSAAEASNILAEIKDFNKQLEEKLSIEHSGWTQTNKMIEANAITGKMNSLNTKINESKLSEEQRNAAKKSLWNHHRLPTSSNPHRGEPVVIQVMEKVSTPEQLNMFKTLRDQELQKTQPKNISQQTSSKNTEQDKRKKMAMDYGKKTLKVASYLTVPTLIGHAIYHGVKKGMKEREKRKQEKPETTKPRMKK